jgi:hypothetical protein
VLLKTVRWIGAGSSGSLQQCIWQVPPAPALAKLLQSTNLADAEAAI